MSVYKSSPYLLHDAIENEDIRLIELLLNQGANPNVRHWRGTALCLAVEKGHEKVVKMLLDRGADIDPKYEITPLYTAIENEKMELIELLLNHGANVNQCSRDTPLICAVERGHKKVVKMLLAKGADINGQDLYGTTPLQCAIENEHMGLIKLLLNYGANVNVSNNHGTTPLHSAAHRGFLKIVEHLLSHEANVNACNDDGETPLHRAIQIGHKKMVEILLKYGATCDSKSSSDFSPLHFAVKLGYLDIVKILLQFGADVDSRDKCGRTALHIACEYRHTKTVIALLEYGSDINIRNGKNRTPLDVVINSSWSLDKRFLLKGFYFYEGEYYEQSICLKQIATIFKQHIVKMETATLYVSKENLLLMSSNLVIRYLQDECEKEVAIMKSEKISNTHISFYDILTKNTNLLAIYVRNENIEQVLRSDDYTTKFPIYASMIKSQFRKGIKRKEMLEQGIKIFYFSFNNFPLPHDCIEKIFSYLNENDLRNLMDACKPASVSNPSTDQ